MTRKRSLFVLVLLLVCGQARAASAVHGGRYRVILTEGAEAGDVFRGCACTIEGEGARFVILGSPATAMRLARDPRVATVEELSADTLRFEPGTEGRGVASDAVASWTTGTYAYDGAGNVVGIGSDVYTYDSAGRLATSSTSGIRQEYTYDRYGNLTSTKTISAGATQIKSAAVAANNRLSTSTGAQYDLSGRLTTAPDLAVVYDDMDMPVETTSGGRRRVHLYTVGDERIATLSFTALNDGLVGTDWTLRDTSGKVLRRLHQDPYGTWSWQQDYVYRDGSLLAAEVATAERTLHFFLDHLGTPRLITNHTGAQIAVHQYYPFGIEQTSPAQDRELLKYTGHERDTPTLDYMHARYYGTEWGRFLSVDPLRDSARPSQPQTWNRYAYVRNKPINRVDRNGLIDVRSDQDMQVTEAPATLVTSSKLIDSTSQGVEYGAILGANGKVSSGIFTSNDPGFVDPRLGVDLTGPSPRVKGTNELPTHSMHTHLAAGKYKVPGTNMTFEATSPGEPSSGDKQMTKATVPGFIVVPALCQVIKVERDGSFKVVLSEKDYDAWAERAAAAVVDEEKEEK